MTIQSHASSDEYRSGWDVTFRHATPEPVKPSERDIARVYCRRLLPHLPCSRETHIALPYWVIMALLGDE